MTYIHLAIGNALTDPQSGARSQLPQHSQLLYKYLRELIELKLIELDYKVVIQKCQTNLAGKK